MDPVVPSSRGNNNNRRSHVWAGLAGVAGLIVIGSIVGVVVTTTTAIRKKKNDNPASSLRAVADPPTAPPSAAPAALPPSVTPSANPSGVPSDTPTFQPSAVPTDAPTLQPSAVPSDDAPTIQPSATSTDAPAAFQESGAASPKPSGRVGVVPTDDPTFQPASTVLTDSPTFRPSGTVPTDAAPTLQPSGIVPTTTSPSSQARGSNVPSPRPSSLPTASSLPTNNPSGRPSSLPSIVPSAVPSTLPSIPPTSFPSATPHVYDVLIVGAGWAGLAAGDTLQNNGITNFEILEARDYVGGRSRTVYPFTNDLAVEMGSAWMYSGTETYDLFIDNDIPLARINYDDEEAFGLYQQGVFSSGENEEESSGEITGSEREALLDDLWWDEYVPFSEEQSELLCDAGSDIPYEQIFQDFLNQTDHPLLLSQESSKARQFLQAMVHAHIEIEYTASLHEISSCKGDSVNECIFCGSNYLVPVDGGGFDKALAILADPLADKTRFNHVVTKIEHSSDQLARVTYSVRDGDNTVEQLIKLAKAVIVTVPLGVLKSNSIEFVPSLSQTKQDAIDFIGFGLLNKCILYWKEDQDAWWPDGKEVLTLITDQDATSGNLTTFFNEKEIGNGGHFVLSAWTGADSAKAMEKQSDEAVVTLALSNLRSMLGDNVPAPSKYVISRWRQDEFAQGSYSFAPVGDEEMVDNARTELGTNDGTSLFWAGEVTHIKWYGTTAGAYRSGIAAAEQVLSVLD